MDGDERADVAERLGPYRLVTRIGEGGMGVVNLALDPDGRTVAVKVLRPQVATDATARARLAREVETMRRVHSPHVAEVLGADLGGEQPYVATRYVQGRSLQEVVSGRGPLTGPSLGRLARGLAEALRAIHAAGVVHRDVKPSNVMLVDGEPVVIDFGVAQAADATKLTQTGMFMGTPAYLAPEVLEGTQPTSAADVHAWAAVVAFAATGRSPFGTGSVEAIFSNIAQGRADVNGVPEPLRGLVRAALARNPSDRPHATWLSERAGAAPGSAGAAGAASLDGSATRRPSSPAAGRVQGGGGPAGAAHGVPATRQYTRSAPPGAQEPAHPRNRDIPPAPDPYRQQPGGPAGDEPRPPATRSPAHPPRLLVGALLVAVLVAFTALAPFAGAAVILLGSAVLRAYDGVAAGLASRRSRRGPRAGDPVLGVVASPWHFAKALVTTSFAALLPVAAGALMTTLVLLDRSNVSNRAMALGGATFALLALFGPGGKVPRQRGERLLAGTLPAHVASYAAAATLGMFLLVLLAAVGSKALIWWPMEPAALRQLLGSPQTFLWFR